jgi:hypothetical protein
MSWSEALVFARDLTLDGSDDWRVPNMHELLSLVHYGRTRPALDPVFDFTPEDSEIDVRPDDSYWSSTTVNHAGLRTQAWSVEFLHGGHDFVEKSQHLAIRVLRAGFIPSRLPTIPPCPLVLAP